MPPLGSVHKSKLTYGDATHETSSVEIYNDAITALSIAGYLTQLTAFTNATDAIVLGVRRQNSWTGDLTVVSNSWPTDPAAQREAKLLVDYQDTTTEEAFTLTIPTIDFSKLVFVPGGGDNVLFAGEDANEDIVAWVTAFEALASPPRDPSHNVEVIGMRFVGRNS